MWYVVFGVWCLMLDAWCGAHGRTADVALVSSSATCSVQHYAPLSFWLCGVYHSPQRFNVSRLTCSMVGVANGWCLTFSILCLMLDGHCLMLHAWCCNILMLMVNVWCLTFNIICLILDVQCLMFRLWCCNAWCFWCLTFDVLMFDGVWWLMFDAWCFMCDVCNVWCFWRLVSLIVDVLMFDVLMFGVSCVML